MSGPDNCLFCLVRIENLLLENGRSNLSARYSMLKVLYIWPDTADDSTSSSACSIYICTRRKSGWGSCRPTHIRPLFGAGTSSLSTFRCRFPREIVAGPVYFGVIADRSDSFVDAPDFTESRVSLLSQRACVKISRAFKSS